MRGMSPGCLRLEPVSDLFLITTCSLVDIILGSGVGITFFCAKKRPSLSRESFKGDAVPEKPLRRTLRQRIHSLT